MEAAPDLLNRVRFLLFKKIDTVMEETIVKPEDWKMFLCYIPESGTQTAVGILMGNEHSAFKWRFYIISVCPAPFAPELFLKEFQTEGIVRSLKILFPRRTFRGKK